MAGILNLLLLLLFFDNRGWQLSSAILKCVYIDGDHFPYHKKFKFNLVF